jgi:hypothetical protein
MGPSSGSSTNTSGVNWMPNIGPYGSMLGIQLTTDIFVELPDDGPVRTETCGSHWNKPVVESYLGLFNYLLLCQWPNLFPLLWYTPGCIQWRRVFNVCFAVHLFQGENLVYSSYWPITFVSIWAVSCKCPTYVTPVTWHLSSLCDVAKSVSFYNQR